MTPELWERVEEVFARVLASPAHERGRLLDELSAGDAAVRREAEELLAEQGSDPGLLDAPTAWLFEADVAAEREHDNIGPYVILRTLGRGGMGQVYLAERVAADFRQTVALKVVRRGLDTDDILARFRNERQILARLEHPNIARLLDVGATERGRPYFVMEYVDGVPVREYCDRERLTLAARLRLFQTICAAVQHAHRNLIVHRDIKPQNILVTGEGVPKLLDFGIAKILGSGEGDVTAGVTRTEARVLTPEYSAPEQIRGDPITTACDVYALGMLLYVLLAGRHPYGSPQTRAELEGLALDVDPSPPSDAVSHGADADAIAAARAATVAQLRHQLQGDLDTIVLRALRKEPEARYASALSLSDDIERHLTGLPVHARAPTTRYRIRKFVARNRLPVAAVTTFVLVLAASTAVALYQAGRIREESARVARERDKALEVRSFLLETFSAGGPDQPTGDTITARELLDRRAATLEGAYSDPELQAEMLTVLAEGYDKLGLIEQAEPLARRGLEMRRALFGATHADVAVSLNVLGWLLHERGQFEQAESLLREAVAVGRAAFPAEGDARLARALNDLALVREARNDYDEAEVLLRESIDMRRRLLGDEHLGVPIAMSNLAVVLHNKGDRDGSARNAEASFDLFRRILGPDHQRTLIVQTNLATFMSLRGDHEGAARQHRDILERQRRLFGARHVSIPVSLTLLANQLMALGQLEESEALLAEAVGIQREHGNRADHIANALRVLGTVKQRAGRHADAVADFTAAIELLRPLNAAYEELAYVLGLRGSSHARLREFDLAERGFREATAVAEQALGPSHGRTLQMRLALVDLLAGQQRIGEARTELDDIERLLAAAGENAGFTIGQPLHERAAAARAKIGR
jgi:serine/threonine-protein kinase